MKRVAIVVGLVAVVASAFALRAVRGGEAAKQSGEVATKVLLCATEMADVCSDLGDATLQVRVEDPGTTLARLRSGGALAADAWLTPRMWSDLAQLSAQAAGRADPFDNVSPTLARTPLVIIIRSDRRAVLEDACGGVIDWVCLARRAGSPWSEIGGSTAWGNLRVGVDRPERTTGGLVTLAQIAATFVHRDTFDARDLDPISSTLDAVAAGVSPSTDRSALDNMLEHTDSYDAAVALEAGTRIAIASPRASGQLELVEVEPTTSADVVLVTAARSSAPIDHNRVQQALTTNGWHFPDKTEPGIPDPATLEDLVARFERAWAGR
jgi:hypothetical protein